MVGLRRGRLDAQFRHRGNGWKLLGQCRKTIFGPPFRKIGRKLQVILLKLFIFLVSVLSFITQSMWVWAQNQMRSFNQFSLNPCAATKAETVLSAQVEHAF